MDDTGSPNSLHVHAERWVAIVLALLWCLFLQMRSKCTFQFIMIVKKTCFPRNSFDSRDKMSSRGDFGRATSLTFPSIHVNYLALNLSKFYAIL